MFFRASKKYDKIFLAMLGDQVLSGIFERFCLIRREDSQLTCGQSITVKNIYYKRYQKRKKWKRPKLSTRTHIVHVSNCRDILADHESEVETDEKGPQKVGVASRLIKPKLDHEAGTSF